MISNTLASLMLKEQDVTSPYFGFKLTYSFIVFNRKVRIVEKMGIIIEKRKNSSIGFKMPSFLFFSVDLSTFFILNMLLFGVRKKDMILKPYSFLLHFLKYTPRNNLYPFVFCPLQQVTAF